MQVSAENSVGNIIPEKDWIIRISAGTAFANCGGTGESAWNYETHKNDCGFQYAIDVLHYKKYIGYGITFKHFTHNLPSIGTRESSIDENIRILYVGPQFSYIDESSIFKRLAVNLDLGIGYAHYLSDGVINGTQNFSLPCSGLGLNINLGFEYKFHIHWGLKIAASGDYYHFKNMHKDNLFTDSFDERNKLNMLILTPQIGLAYHF